MRVFCLLPEKKDFLQGLAEAAYSLSPKVACSSEAVFFESSRVESLFPEPIIRERLLLLAKSYDTGMRIGIAADPATALALALSQKRRREDLPLEFLPLYLDPFGVRQSFEKMLDVFQRLGLKTCGDLKKIPRKGLASRLGSDAIRALERWEKPLMDPWPLFQPAEEIFENFAVEPEHDVRYLEPLLFLLRPMLERVVARLLGRGRHVLALKLTLHLEDYPQVEERERVFLCKFSYPLSVAGLILPLIQERLSHALEREPLRSPVNEIRICVEESIPGLARQKNLFHQREEEQEAWRSLVSRLHERLGQERAFLAIPTESYEPESGWKRSLEAAETQMILPFAERPLVLLKKPEPLQVLDKQFVYKGKRHRVLSCLGPERISGAWWFRDTERSYYQLHLDSGERWWIFRLEQEPRIFLHGIFD